MHRFLWSMLDAPRNNSTPHVTNLLMKMNVVSSVVRNLFNTRRGSACDTLFQLHNTLIFNHKFYAAPYINASVTQDHLLQRVRLAGLKAALGMPRETATKDFYSELSSVRISAISNARATGPKVRLHLTEPGRRFV